MTRDGDEEEPPEGTDWMRAEADAAAERIPDDRPQPTPLWALLSRWLLALEAWLRSRGGEGLRRGLRIFWVFVAAVGAFLLVGPVINPPQTLDDILSSASTATDTWIARDFDADYVLSRDADGRLQVEVTETIDALFPDDVDESGIERVLATQYEGHALDPQDVTVALDGDPLDPSVRTTPDRMTIGMDSGGRLTGDHEFVVSYRLHDLAYQTTDDITGETIDMLDWGVFGPSWPQAFTGLDVSVTMPDDLADQLIRPPRGNVAWSIVTGGDWLEPEDDSPAGETTYAFTVDQNIPPHGQAWFTMRFADGTFTMPPVNPYFLLQTFGPVLPLAILVVTLLFSLAARAVAWSDARGRPWFIAQYDPPKGVTPATAAQILERSRARELALALAHYRSADSGSRRDAAIGLGRVARRTGRVGDRLRAALAFSADPAHRQQVGSGYRRIPRGFVRDWFIAAPLALAVLQVGLVRQLSYQATLAIVWWPAAFVAASLVLSVVVLSIALSARPLTRKGALARQYLQGIGVFAERTSLVERGPLSDPLLPYAVLLDDPRRAGQGITELVIAELGGEEPLRGWRTRDFLTWPRLLIRGAAVLVVIGTALVVAFLPNPYARSSPTLEDWDFDGAGTLYTSVDAVDIAASLTIEDGAPRLEVTQTTDVTFDEEADQVPQFAQRWPASIDAQDLGFAIESVTLDGKDIAYSVSRDGDRELFETKNSDVLDGSHAVVVTYTLETPVTAGIGSPLSDADGGVVDRIRWAALLDGWDSGWTYPSEPDVSASLTVADDLADRATSAGWLREDLEAADGARDGRDSVYPFGTAATALAPSEYLDDAEREKYGSIDESTSREDGSTTHVIEVTTGEYGNPQSGAYSDFGAMLEFPAGTFPGTDADALRAQQAYGDVPMVLVWSVAAVAAVIAVTTLLRARVRGSRRSGPGTGRDLAWWLGTTTSLATVVLFFWASADMPADWPEFPPLAFGGLVGLLAGVLTLVFARPERAAAVRPGTPRRPVRAGRRGRRGSRRGA